MNLPRIHRDPDGTSYPPIGIFYDPGPKPSNYPEGTGQAHSNIIILPDHFERRQKITFSICEFGTCRVCVPDRPRTVKPSHPALERPWLDRMHDAGFEAVSIPRCIWYQPPHYLYLISMVYWKLALHEGRPEAADHQYEAMLEHAPRRTA
jgi:hypothetical protein